MMKLLVLFAIIVAVALKAQAAVQILPPQKPPTGVPFEQGCWVPDLNQFVDESYYSKDGTCTWWQCRGDGTTQVITCPRYGGNCTVVPGDSNAVYPGCCESLKCADGEVGYGS